MSEPGPTFYRGVHKFINERFGKYKGKKKQPVPNAHEQGETKTRKAHKNINGNKSESEPFIERAKKIEPLKIDSYRRERSLDAYRRPSVSDLRPKRHINPTVKALRSKATDGVRPQTTKEWKMGQTSKKMKKLQTKRKNDKRSDLIESGINNESDFFQPKKVETIKGSKVHEEMTSFFNDLSIQASYGLKASISSRSSIHSTTTHLNRISPYVNTDNQSRPVCMSHPSANPGPCVNCVDTTHATSTYLPHGILFADPYTKAVLHTLVDRLGWKPICSEIPISLSTDNIRVFTSIDLVMRESFPSEEKHSLLEILRCRRALGRNDPVKLYCIELKTGYKATWRTSCETNPTLMTTDNITNSPYNRAMLQSALGAKIFEKSFIRALRNYTESCHRGFNQTTNTNVQALFDCMSAPDMNVHVKVIPVVVHVTTEEVNRTPYVKVYYCSKWSKASAEEHLMQ